jgi:hypothetical protein
MTPGEPQDVASYVAARWADLVRTLVELGAAVPEAELAARDACARTWRAWAREHRTGDVDVLVFEELLHRWGWPQERPDLDPERVAQVLVTTGRVSEHAAELVTGADAGGTPVTAAWAPDDDLYRGVAPVAEIRDDLRRRRRRTTTVVAAAAVVLSVGVGLVRVLDTGPDRPDRPDQPDRPVVANPLPLAWWSVGALNLGRSRVAVPGLVELAQAGDEESSTVVYLDDRGGVWQVDDTTDPELVGRSEPGSGIRATEEGRAAWIEVGDDAPAVVVWDTVERRILGRLVLEDPGGPAEVVALDGDTVYLRTPVGTRSWELGDVEALPARGVVTARDGVLVVTEPPSRTDDAAPVRAGPRRFTVDADLRAALSPDGLIVATWMPGSPDLALTGPGASLATVPLQLPERDGIGEARFAPNGDLVLVLTREPSAGGAVTVATCVLNTGVCEQPVRTGAGRASATGVPQVILTQ